MKQGHKLHHLGPELTKAVKEQYPNAVLRDRELYGDEDGTEPGNNRRYGLEKSGQQDARSGEFPREPGSIAVRNAKDR